jgi:SAM-dependent methyltransferase
VNREDAEEYTQSLSQIVGASFRQIALAHRMGVPKTLGFKGKQATKDWVLERLGAYVQMQLTERKRAELELKTEGYSNRAIAQIVGVDETTVRRDQGAAFAAEQEENASDSNDGCSHNAANAAPIIDAIPQGQKTRTANENARKAELEQPVNLTLASGLHHGDFRKLSDQIADASVQLVFTDPPYDRESVDLYDDAARVARRILKPGGSFIAYSGQKHLPHVLTACARHLDYWWTIAGVHAGGNQILNKLGVRCGWKPLVWFVKGTRGDVQNILADVISGAREKDNHEWQQAEEEARYYIEKLTSPDGLVVDFFIGGGTTAAAAKALGRQWIGFEIDAKSADRASRRIDEAA